MPEGASRSDGPQLVRLGSLGAVLAVGAGWLPGIGVFLALASALSFGILAGEVPAAWGVGAVLATVAVCTWLQGWGPGLAMLAVLGGVSLVSGATLRRRWNLGTQVLLVSGGLVVGFWVAAVMFAWIPSGQPLAWISFLRHEYDGIQAAARASAGSLIAAYRQQGLAVGPHSQARTATDLMVQAFGRYLPATLVLLTLVGAGVETLALRRLWRWHDPGVTPDPPFRTWVSPSGGVTIYAIGWAMAIGGNLVARPALSTVGWNVVVVASAVYAVQGLAVLVHYLHSWRVSGLPRVLVVALVLATPLIDLLLWVGLVDSLWNLRRPRTSAHT